MRVELGVDLLGLALMYLQRSKKEVTAYALLTTCEQILQWSEHKGRGTLTFKNGKVCIDKDYFSDGIWSKTEPYVIVGLKERDYA